jgi:glycosyltransferase involved in cell wall biosynthesis
LQGIGVDARKIIPWDWPHPVEPSHFTPKPFPARPAWRLLFIGNLSEAKGLGDAMRAVAALKARAIDVTLAYAGRGDVDGFAALASSLAIADRVEYLGLVAHAAVIPLMRDADVVLIPSRHEYPEGFPMTIYEALTSRTPIVASDHPMYAAHLSRSGAAVVYPAGEGVAMADALAGLMRAPHRYVELSRASADAWQRLQLPVTWGGLVGSWLSGAATGRFDVSRHALAALPPPG